MNISKVTDSKAKDFLKVFLNNRAINREFYILVPENKLDFRMVNTPRRKSDSPRESLAHQIAVQQIYLKAVTRGILTFSDYHDSQLKKKSKKELLILLDQADKKMVDILSNNKLANKKIKVPWSKTPFNVVSMFWSLDSHEILHTGWNLAVMDHLNIPRFKQLKEMWGN